MIAQYQSMIKEMLADLKSRKDLKPHTIAGRLLAVRDPATGQPLHEDILLAEFALLYVAGAQVIG